MLNDDVQRSGSVSRGPHRFEEEPPLERGAGQKQPSTDGSLRCLCRHCQQDKPVKWQGKRIEENCCVPTNIKSNPETALN